MWIGVLWGVARTLKHLLPITPQSLSNRDVRDIPTIQGHDSYMPSNRH